MSEFSKDDLVCSNYPKPTILRLVLLGLIVITPSITPGMSVGFPAIALPQLHLDIENTSWFGFVIDRYGRRTALIFSIIPSILGWFLLSGPSQLSVMYGGRLLTGFALGAASLPSSVYAAECITSNHLSMRGSLTTWTTMAISSGLLIVYFLGAFLPYNQVAFAAACISVLSLVLIFFYIPESPTWLYRRGRRGDAELAQKRLGIGQPLLGKTKGFVGTFPNHQLKSSSSVAKILRRDVYKPLLITIGFLFCLQFSGVYALNTYMVDIIKTDSVSIDSYLLAVISGALQVLGVICITFVIPRTGVKRLCIMSTLGTAFGMAAIGVSSAFTSPTLPILDWMHVFAVWLAILAASLGFLAVPYSLLGEMFPVDAKGFASISLVSSSTFNFIILKVHPYFHVSMGGYTYFIYAAISLFGTFFVIFFVPETVGKTLEQLKDEFNVTNNKENGKDVDEI